MRIQPSSNDTPSVFVAWQDPGTRQWHTIAKLSLSSDDLYEFSFTHGAEALRDVAKRLFNSNLEGRFFSNGLTALFRNKIPPRSRSDFFKMAEWLNLKGDEADFELLGKFGLIPGSDGLLVYPAPKIKDDHYSVEFFVHGIRHAHGDTGVRHLHGDVLTWCHSAKAGDNLYALLDVQNRYDENSVALRADDASIVVGYVPRFYAGDLRKILGNPELARNANFEIRRNNADAPLQLRLLCRFTCSVPAGFSSLDDVDHEIRPSLVPFDN